MQFSISDDILRLIELVAAVVTILGFMIAIISRFLKHSDDPYLKSYTIACFIFVLCVWLIMRFLEGVMQKHIIHILFIITAVITTGIVIWRGLETKMFLKSKDFPLPIGFKHVPNKTPYWVLLGTLTLTILLLFFIYTAVPENQGNLFPILTWLVGLIVWLFICRLIWEYFDNLIFIEQKKRDDTPLLWEIDKTENDKKKTNT